jgi:hypothetical protein
MDDARRALDAVVGATDEQLLPIAAPSSEGPGGSRLRGVQRRVPRVPRVPRGSRKGPEGGPG